MRWSANEWIAENARLIIALLLIASVVVGAGGTMLEQSTSLDQFQTGAEEADAQEYADDNFGAGSDNTTTAQVIVEDDNVLDKETLLSMLEYQETLRENETVNVTLKGDGSLQSVANVVAQTAIRTDEREAIRERERELTEAEHALENMLVALERDPEGDIRAAFENVDRNTSVNMTEEDYQLLETAVEDRREAGNDEERGGAGTDNGRTGEKAGGDGPEEPSVTAQILADEYKKLAEQKEALKDSSPSLETQRETVEEMNKTELDQTVADALGGTETSSDRAARTGRSVGGLVFMPNYYEPGETESNATLLVVTQQNPGSSFAPGDAPEKIEDSQAAMADLAPDDDLMSVLIYGDGVVSTEISDSMRDSILLVGPLAIAFVLVVLVIIYRDPLDIVLGLIGIALVLVWTFGTMGWFDISFSQPFIVVLVLLIGLSIDYGIHVVMRYREARPSEETSPAGAMAVALGSVGIALLYVTATTTIGFLSNLTSPLGVFRDLGLVSAIGIVSTLIIFGSLVPALKVELDTALEGKGLDRVKPAVGTGAGPVNRLLDKGTSMALKAPYVVLAVALVISGMGAYGATDIDASFEQSDFLADDPGDWMKDLPEPFAPGTYTGEAAINKLDSSFVRQDTTATILVRGDVTDPDALERLDDAERSASEMDVVETYADGEPAITHPLSVMEEVAAENESFNATVEAADDDGDGVPDRNVADVYDEMGQIAPDRTADVITDADEYEAVRMVITVDGDADGETVHNRLEDLASDIDGAGMTAIATGDVIVNQITADELAETAILSLIVALLSVLVVLVMAYRFMTGAASLGFVTLVPVVFTLTWVLGTMALLDIPFNIVTGMITGLTIGLGVDYSLHISERFNQELGPAESVSAALHKTVTGTGGALLSSATTTAAGFAVLLVAILPFLQSFGLITALTIVYAFIASVFVLPSLLVIWTRFIEPGETLDGTTRKQEPDASPTVTRTVDSTIVSPGESVTVTVTVSDYTGRAALEENAPGEISQIDIEPDPVTKVQERQTITVFWETEETVETPTVTYRVEVLDTATDGQSLSFGGTLDVQSGRYSVDDHDGLTVVNDVFQRVLERGSVTEDDIVAAVKTEDLTSEELDRLRRIWVIEE